MAKKTLKEQVKAKAQKPVEEKKSFEGSFNTMISTGSTLLDLNISGGVVKGGGLPGGIFVEIAGPEGCGKTVLLSEIGGDIQRKGGELTFNDPEARLNRQFAKMFDLDIDKMIYDTPDTVTKVFENVREMSASKKDTINGSINDSLAALSTNLEMDNKEGDKMGMRRAKEFSEQLRKTCRVLVDKNILMVCSNQIRVNTEASKYQSKVITPGGKAIAFYASLRLLGTTPTKIKKTITVSGKKVEKTIGVCTTFTVSKNSVWSPYRSTKVSIIFDYGVDDIRDNLQYVKDYTDYNIYTVKDIKLDRSIDKSILMVEEQGLVNDLKKQVINLWQEIEDKFKVERKKKLR